MVSNTIIKRDILTTVRKIDSKSLVLKLNGGAIKILRVKIVRFYLSQI